ncbi:TIGR00730 family Rossman fold protein [Pedobacter sp.]|nr:TIGR00730 family Rossman fold protein [Candidatus Saccharibacteria bacterium]
MAKILRDLLLAEEPIFSLSLRQLEKASGDQGTDVKLIGEISEKMRLATKALGLDPKDTTGVELYKALLSRIAVDNARVTKLIGGKNPDNVGEMVPLMVRAVNKMDIDTTCWVLKHSVAKRLLKTMPPKKLMAHLGYRSIDSMLKHEDIDEVYTALRFSEGGDWLNEYNELFKSVTPSDFETREIRILVMDHKKYVDLATHFVEKKLHNITHTKEMGTIVVVPMHRTHMKGITLKSLPLIFHYINEIRLYSSFFKLKQVNKDFGRTVVETLIADPGAASQMAGQKVHWRVIQRYFGKTKDENHPEAFEPHVHPEDLHWRRAEELLTKLDPEMAFWQEMDYVGAIYNGQPITLNLMDVSLSYSNEETYDNRYVYHFRESLWNEIFMRYMGHKNLEDQILSQLDNDMIAPESLVMPGKIKKTPSPTIREVPALEAANKANNLLVRQKLIDAAEGRLVGVIEEFDKAFDILVKYEKTVSIFGSARLAQDSPSCVLAYDVAHRIASAGFAVATGGGHGVMEAANHGALDAGGTSIGLNINLPTEQTLNNFTTEHYTFEHFFARKVALTLDASAYIFCPGGFGTLDELFEIVTLEQTGIINKAPIILLGSEFWKPLDHFIKSALSDKFQTIAKGDTDLYRITDSIDDILSLLGARELVA